MKTIGRAGVIDGGDVNLQERVEPCVGHSFRQLRNAIHFFFAPGLGDALCFRLNDVGSFMHSNLFVIARAKPSTFS
jgi:hypothetical protein